MDITKNTKRNKIKTTLKVIYSFIILAFVLTCFTGCKIGDVEVETTIHTREATINDITIDNSNDFALSMNYTMIPKVDIKNLELKFEYKNSKGKILSTKKKTIGTVKKGIQYKIKINLTEFGLFDLFKISYASISVSEGTVSLI